MPKRIYGFIMRNRLIESEKFEFDSWKNG